MSEEIRWIALPGEMKGTKLEWFLASCEIAGIAARLNDCYITVPTVEVDENELRSAMLILNVPVGGFWANENINIRAVDLHDEHPFFLDNDIVDDPDNESLTEMTGLDSREEILPVLERVNMFDVSSSNVSSIGQYLPISPAIAYAIVVRYKGSEKYYMYQGPSINKKTWDVLLSEAVKAEQRPNEYSVGGLVHTLLKTPVTDGTARCFRLDECGWVESFPRQKK